MYLKPLYLENNEIVQSSVLSLVSLIKTDDTVLDIKAEEEGASILLDPSWGILDYRSRPMNEVFIPPVKSMQVNNTVILSPVQVAAQSIFSSMLVSILEIQRAVSSYQSLIIRMVWGRKGYLSKLINNRMKQSGRAVLLASEIDDPCYCEIPQWMMTAINTEENDLVIVGRDPSIWDGSIELFIAKGCEGDSIKLHPLAFQQLGADSDGDQVWVLGIPKDLQVGLLPSIFLKKNASWVSPWKKDSVDIDWDTISEEMRSRKVVTGESITPRDILEHSKIFKDLEDSLDKEDLHKDMLASANGYDIDEWKSIVTDVNKRQLDMKVGMGPAGACALGLRTVAGDDIILIKSANLVGERLEQILLGSKKRTSSFDYNTVIAIMNRNANYVTMPFEQVCSLLASTLGITSSDVLPILSRCWEGGQGLRSLLENDYPVYTGLTRAGETKGINSNLFKRVFGEGQQDAVGITRSIMEVIGDMSSD